MKVFRVVTQRDGEMTKKPGKCTTEIKQIDYRFAAETMQEVWDYFHERFTDYEEELIAVIEEHASIILVTPNAKVRGDAPLYGAASLSTDGLCDEDRT